MTSDSYDGVITITIDGKDAEKEANALRRVLDGVDDSAKRSKSSAKQLSQSFGLLKGAMVGITGLSFGAILKGSSDKAAEFENAVSNLSAITGATGKDLDYLANKARELGAATTLSATQSAQAFKLIASGKPELLENAEALASVTKEAVTLAEAAGITLPEAANALTSSLNQFSADASEASRYINVLAAGSKLGASEITDLAASMKYAGVTASGAGVSFETTVAALEVLGKAAIKGEQAGTNLRNIILKLQTAGDDGLNPSLVGLSEALENLNERELNAIEMKKLFGLETINAAQALLKEIPLLKKLEEGVAGTAVAYEQARVNTDNLIGDKKRLASAIEEVQISLGEQLNPTIREFVQGLTEAVNSIPDIVTEMQLFGQFLMEDFAISMVEAEFHFKKMFAGMKGTANVGIAFLLSGFRAFTLEIAELFETLASVDIPFVDEDFSSLKNSAEKIRNFGSSIKTVGESIDDMKTELDELKASEKAQIELLQMTSTEINEEIIGRQKQGEAIAKVTTELEKLNKAGGGNKPTAKPVKGKYDDYLKSLKEMQAEMDTLPDKVYVLDEAMMNGVISAELHARALENLTGTIGDTGEALVSMEREGETFGATMLSGVKRLTDGFVNLAFEGKRSFKDMAGSIISDIAAMIAKQAIFNAISTGLSGTSFGKMLGIDAKGEHGLAFNNGVVAMAQGGLIDRPTIFPMATGGLALAGEAGTEAIMPLQRTSSGDLGVKAQGMGAKVYINIENNSGAEAEVVGQRQNGDGTTVIDIVVNEVRNVIANDVARGNGPLSQAIEGTYGLNRAVGSYR